MAGKQKPILALTMGDAAGIGPEIIVKALSSRRAYTMCLPLVIGDSATLVATIKLLESPLHLHTVAQPEEAQGRYGSIDLLDMGNLDQEDVISGQVSAACGKAAMEYIARAAGYARKGTVAAMVTAPINKEAVKLAGYQDISHLEYLARLSNAVEYDNMLVSGTLRVIHLTTHHSLKDAVGMVTKERILARLKLADGSFRRWGFICPRIAVAALNPHGGEGGLFGKEEIEQIAPAVVQARSLGIDARGPFPADSVFLRAIGGEFDGVIAMYHDQGHIAIKVHGFENSVSVALGLPFIRTSVDHGTAFDIAGKGIASARSMEEAILTAVSLIGGKLPEASNG